MEIRNLRAFTTVARLMSFQDAAEELHYAQSTISAQIHSLEEELGVRLFERLGRHIRLTESGERLLDYAGKILDLEKEAKSELLEDGANEGLLTIRVPESFCVYRLPPALKQFQQIMPRVRLKLITCAHDGLAKDLRQGITDLAFLFAEGIQSADLRAEFLYTELLVPISSPHHPLVGKSTVTIGDLEGETLLLSKVDCSYRHLVEGMMRAAKVSYRTMEFHSMAAVKRCVAEGLGVAWIPETTIGGALSRGEVVVLPWGEGMIEVGLLMIRHKGKWVSPALRALISCVRKALDGPVREGMTD